MSKITLDEIKRDREMMGKARSWKELNMTLKDVCDLLDKIIENFGEINRQNENEEESQKMIQELNDKIARLTTTNKQLRAENKALRAEGKE